jgi:cold shock protein
MKSGTVKWFNDAKGYGFLIGPEQRDIFVHFSAIEGRGFKSLVEGEEVEFEEESGPRGMQAIRVVRLNPPPVNSNRLD